jgi:hypothetical protein
LNFQFKQTATQISKTAPNYLSLLPYLTFPILLLFVFDSFLRFLHKLYFNWSTKRHFIKNYQEEQNQSFGRPRTLSGGNSRATILVNDDEAGKESGSDS